MDQAREAIKRVIKEDKSKVSYRPSWRDVTGSLTSAILISAVMDHWLENEERPFHKFHAPPEKYKKHYGTDKEAGQATAWTEDLGMTRAELQGACKKLGALLSLEEVKDWRLTLEKHDYLVGWFRDQEHRTWWYFNEQLFFDKLTAHYLSNDINSPLSNFPSGKFPNGESLTGIQLGNSQVDTSSQIANSIHDSLYNKNLNNKSNKKEIKEESESKEIKESKPNVIDNDNEQGSFSGPNEPEAADGKPGDNLSIDYNHPPISHFLVEGKKVYYRESEDSPLMPALIKRSTPKRVRLFLWDTEKVITKDPTERVFFKNGTPDLIPVCIGERDPEQERIKLTPNQLALKNQLIDMINYAPFGESEGAREKRMSEIQKAALEMDSKGNTVEDLKDYQRWYDSHWMKKAQNPITIQFMRKTWNAEFKPWQAEQRIPQIKTSVSQESDVDSEIEIVPSFMQQSNEPQTPQGKALSEFLERIKLAMTPRSFDDLFADASAKSLEGDVLTVMVSEERQRLVIENRYREVVKRTLAQMGAEFEVKFEVGGAK